MSNKTAPQERILLLSWATGRRLYRCKVAPLRVDDYMTLIRGGDEAGRDPAIEPADDTFSIVTQELDELLLVLRLDGQDVDKGGDLFRHLYGRVHDVLL